MCLVQKFLTQGKKLYCCYIDYEKAFDKVWRSGLWAKLIKEGVSGKVFTVITNMYSHIKSCVSANGCTTDFFRSDMGVRQGENLSPLVFAVYLNDLEDFLSKNEIKHIQVSDGSINNTMLKLLVIIFRV